MPKTSLYSVSMVITLTDEPMVPNCAFLATFWSFSTQIVPKLA